jgi:taurine--2-oxoglutarate transaminase
VGIATLQVYQEEGLIDNAARLGKVLGEWLEDMKARHPCVGDVRYIGLFSTIELVKNRATKEPLPSAPLANLLRNRGLSTLTPANLISICPPLCITEPQLSDGLRIIEEVLDIADKEYVQ